MKRTFNVCGFYSVYLSDEKINVTVNYELIDTKSKKVYDRTGSIKRISKKIDLYKARNEIQLGNITLECVAGDTHKENTWYVDKNYKNTYCVGTLLKIVGRDAHCIVVNDNNESQILTIDSTTFLILANQSSIAEKISSYREEIRKAIISVIDIHNSGGDTFALRDM